MNKVVPMFALHVWAAGVLVFSNASIDVAFGVSDQTEIVYQYKVCSSCFPHSCLLCTVCLLWSLVSVSTSSLNVAQNCAVTVPDILFCLVWVPVAPNLSEQQRAECFLNKREK